MSSVSPVGSPDAQPPSQQVSVTKKRDFGFVESYELKVTFGDKTVSVPMNVFKTPWGKKINAANLQKKLCDKLGLNTLDQVNSFMRVWLNSAIELEKSMISAGPQELKALNQLRQEADVSVRAMTLFFKSYPASYQLDVQLSEFEVLSLEKGSAMKIIKKDMALLYNELMQPSPREDVVKRIAESISDRIDKVNSDKNPEYKNKMKEALVKSYKKVASPIQEREVILKQLASLEKSSEIYLQKEGDPLPDQEYQKILKFLEESNDPSLYKSLVDGKPEDFLSQLSKSTLKNCRLNFDQFNRLVQCLDSKMNKIKTDYESDLADIVDLKETAYQVVDSEERKRVSELEVVRDQHLRDVDSEHFKQLEQIGDLKYNGKFNGLSLNEVEKEISSINQPLSALDDKLGALNKELDEIVNAPEDTRPSFKVIFSRLLEDSPVEQSLTGQAKELMSDVKSLVTYPLQSAWIKLNDIKARGNIKYKELRLKFNVINNEYIRLDKKKDDLIDQKDNIYSTIAEMTEKLEDDIQLKKERIHADYHKALKDSMKAAAIEYRDLTKKADSKESVLAKEYQESLAVYKKIHKMAEETKEIAEKKELGVKGLSQKVAVIEGELGMDLKSLSDVQAQQSLVALQLTLLCGLSALGVETIPEL